MKKTSLKSFLGLILVLDTVRSMGLPKAIQLQKTPPSSLHLPGLGDRTLNVQTIQPQTRTDFKGRKLCGCGRRKDRRLEEVPDRSLPEHVMGGTRSVDMYRGKPNHQTEMNNVMDYLQQHPNEDNEELWSYLCCQDHSEGSMHTIGQMVGPNMLALNPNDMTSAWSHSMPMQGHDLGPDMMPQNQQVMMNPIQMMLSGLLGHPHSAVTLPLDHDEDMMGPNLYDHGNVPMMNAMESRESQPPVMMGMVEVTKRKRLPNGHIEIEHMHEPIGGNFNGGMMFGAPQIQIDNLPIPMAHHEQKIQHQIQHFEHFNPLTGQIQHTMATQTNVQHKQMMGPNPVNILFHNLLGGLGQMGQPKHLVKTIHEEIMIPIGGGKPIIRKEIHLIHHNIEHIQPQGMIMELGPQGMQEDEHMFHPDDEILFHSNEHHDDMMGGKPHNGTEIIEIIGGPHPNLGASNGPGDVGGNQIMDAIIQSMLLNHLGGGSHVHIGKAAQTVHVGTIAHDPLTGSTAQQHQMQHQETTHHIVHNDSANIPDTHPTSLIDGLLNDLEGQVNLPGTANFKRHQDLHDDSTSCLSNSTPLDMPTLPNHVLPEHHQTGDYPLMNPHYSGKQQDNGLLPDQDEDDVSKLLRDMTDLEDQSNNSVSSGLGTSPTGTDSEISDLGHMLNGIDLQHEPVNAMFDSSQHEHSSRYPLQMSDVNHSDTSGGVLDSEFQRTNVALQQNPNIGKDRDDDWEQNLLNSFLSKLKKRSKLSRRKKNRHKKRSRKRAKLAKKKKNLMKSRKLRRETRQKKYLKELEDIYGRNKALMKQHHFAKQMFLNRLITNKQLLKSYLGQKKEGIQIRRERRERRLKMMSKAEKKLKQFEHELGEDMNDQGRKLAAVKNGAGPGSFASNKRKALEEFREAMNKMKPRQP